MQFSLRLVVSYNGNYVRCVKTYNDLLKKGTRVFMPALNHKFIDTLKFYDLAIHWLQPREIPTERQFLFTSLRCYKCFLQLQLLTQSK